MNLRKCNKLIYNMPIVFARNILHKYDFNRLVDEYQQTPRCTTIV